MFQSRGIDYRLIAIGSLLPLVLDIPFGYRAYGYTLLFAVVLLALAMVVTIGRPRLLRRRLLCLPIGVFAGLVLSGAFTNSVLVAVPRHHVRARRAVPTWWVVVIEEVVGLFVCWVLVGQYDLYLPEPSRVPAHGPVDELVVAVIRRVPGC